MKFAKGTSGIKRYIALDIHKEYALVGGQNARQEWMTDSKRMITDIPMETYRSSPSEWSGLDIVAILGSLKMVAPSSKLTPCF
jgi:hypothetical protein